jgi:hypothetical protein
MFRENEIILIGIQNTGVGLSPYGLWWWVILLPNCDMKTIVHLEVHTLHYTGKVNQSHACIRTYNHSRKHECTSARNEQCICNKQICAAHGCFTKYTNLSSSVTMETIAESNHTGIFKSMRPRSMIQAEWAVRIGRARCPWELGELGPERHHFKILLFAISFG